MSGGPKTPEVSFDEEEMTWDGMTHPDKLDDSPQLQILLSYSYRLQCGLDPRATKSCHQLQ